MTKREEAGANYATEMHRLDPKSDLTKIGGVAHDFVRGAEWEAKHGDIAQKTIERVLGLLRSEEAEHKPRIAGSQFEFEKAWDNGQGWADWLEARLKLKEAGK